MSRTLSFIAVRDKHQDFFGEHAATMIQFMWQDDMRALASFINNVWMCVMTLSLIKTKHQICPRWLEMM